MLGIQPLDIIFNLFSYSRLANQRYIDMYDTDYDNRSALHLAACQGHYKAVEYLLNNNAGYPIGVDRYLVLTKVVVPSIYMCLYSIAYFGKLNH